MKKKEKKEPAYDHKHLATANHSPQQHRMFFGVGKLLGHDSKEMIARAKAKYEVACFNELTSTQMNWMIDRLVRQQFTPKKGNNANR